MHQLSNPFIQHALQHGQALLGESGRSAALSQNLVSACDDILVSLNSGNLQGAGVSAQNARNMAMQVAQSTRHVNTVLNERIDMAYYVMSRIQQNIGEMTGALQSIRSARPTTQFHPTYINYTTQ
ncbi:MAG: hypothetical protein JL50_18600 [Peptococcaceae bacterium BICA1-7]|nr:MAG: hypothetical protein JL50_18600 [Peptococcaceae bacterium BICA1-7]HBV99054.1 hypothetical protein [Desulfotomaculum sp.]